MAIYHFSTKPVSRKHKSSVAVSAYINAEKYTDERTGRTFDYSNKKGVLVSACYALDENNNRIRLKNTELWNASEQAEAKNKRQDSARTAREYIVAIPHELMEKDKKEGVKCIVNFCDKLAKKYNVAVEFALHDQDYDSDGVGNKNYHFHLITTTRAVTFDDQNNIVFGKKAAFEMSDSDLKKMGEKRTKDQLIDIRKLWADVANKYLEKHNFDERIDHRSLKEQGLDRKPKIRLSMADSEKEKNGERTKAGDYNRAIDQSIALKKELDEIEKSLKKYELLEKLGDTTSKISEKSDLFFDIFGGDDDDDFDSFADVKTLPIKAPTSPAPMPPTQNNNAKNEAVERPAPTVETPKQPINENKAPTATAPALDKKPQAQLSPGLATQNTPTPPIQEPPKQAKTAQQQPLQPLQTKPTPPRPTTQDRAEDKAPVKPTITQEPPPQEQEQKPLTAYDRPINAYYDILATHKRSFAKQNDISTVKKLYPSDEPIYLNFQADKGSISLNKGKQKTDLHFEIYKRFREVADKATSEVKRTSEVIRNYMTLSVNQFTARYNIELTDADKKDIESKDRLLKIDDFKNNYVEKEKPQLTPNESAKLKGQSIKLN